MESIKITIENCSTTYEFPVGITLREVVESVAIESQYPMLAAYVNNRLRELSYPMHYSASVRFVNVASFAGVRTYHRTTFLILQKTIEELYPQHKLHIRHSMGQSGFYCEIEGVESFTQCDTDAIRQRMQQIIDSDMKIKRCKMLTSELRSIYEELGYNAKIQLLDTHPRLYSEIYILDKTMGYYYGSLAPSTSHIHLFDIQPYYNGFYLALPRREEPSLLDISPKQDKMCEIFREYQKWVDVMGVPNVGDLNGKILKGDTSELIKIAEAFHEKKIAELADTVAYAVEARGCRMALISGPSSSGKTTTSKRVGIQLRVLGYKPVLISLDDYFVDRDQTPLDENGEYDYEALEAINIKLFNDNLRRLFAGESVDIPRYDFISGQQTMHEKPLTLDDKSIIIIEGIHGLNPKLTPEIDEDIKFKIYVSCFTTVAMDNTSRISSSDNRLLRRLTRDFRTRGTDAISTLKRWESVRRGEEKHIFPYQENADVMFNSSLFYEIPVIQKYAISILRSVPDTIPEFEEARRMLKFLDHFTPIPDQEIPPTSILREFIGGSSFSY